MQIIILIVWFRSPGVGVMVIQIISMFYDHILSWAVPPPPLFIFFLLKSKLLANLSTPFCLLLWTRNSWAWGRRDILSGAALLHHAFLSCTICCSFIMPPYYCENTFFLLYIFKFLKWTYMPCSFVKRKFDLDKMLILLSLTVFKHDHIVSVIVTFQMF